MLFFTCTFYSADRDSAEKIAKPRRLQEDQYFDVNRSPQQHIDRSLEVLDATQIRPRSPPIDVYQGNVQFSEW